MAGPRNENSLNGRTVPRCSRREHRGYGGALRASYVDTVTAIEAPLATAITERCPGVDRLTAEVLAASVTAARVALRRWLQAATAVPSPSGLVVPSGSLPDLKRTRADTARPSTRCGNSPGGLIARPRG